MTNYKKMLEEQTTGTSIDLDKVAPTDSTLVPLKINGVDLKAPRKYLDDNTAIAGKINPAGVIKFSRCKPENSGNYDGIKTDHGMLSFGGNFKEALKSRVK